MERKEAEDALALIRQVVNRVHDDTVLQDWGRVMIVMAVLDLLAFGLTQLFLLQGITALTPYGITWGVYLVLAFSTNFITSKQPGGTATYVERHIWGNGITYYLASFAVVALDFHCLEVDRALAIVPAHIAVISAVSFAFIALLHPRFYAYTLAFFLLAALIGFWPTYGFGWLGLAWFLSLMIPGLQFSAEKRRLLASGDATRFV